ncbi:MAG: hypothetical protein KA354_09885 [Phycisphaerae bacterium]|nr:hypothetical protein [Phycisphaerae bacterium]
MARPSGWGCPVTLVGEKYYQEAAPEKVMGRAEGVSLNEAQKTPAGNLEKCLHVKETTLLERGMSHKG